MANGLITVFGGGGFVGRYVVSLLAARGYRLRIAVRRPDEALFLKPLGSVGQITLVQANIRDDASVAAAVAGVDTVINLVGILYESGRQKFDAVHVEGARRIASASAAAGVHRLIHCSALGADVESPSRYSRSKGRGEAAVSEAFPNAVILRPGVIFGPEDDFINRFAFLARLSPVLPLIGGGETRFQPVYVGDVAAAVARVVETGKWAGKTFELGGPTQYSLRDLFAHILRETGRRRLMVPVPIWFAKLKATFLQLLPKPLLSVDQVRLLAVDNVVAPKAAGLEKLGIAPTPLEAITPTYLWRFRKTGQYARPVAG